MRGRTTVAFSGHSPPPSPARGPHDLSIDWARLLRLPPHEHDFPLRPRGGTENKFGCAAPRPYTAAVFPLGSKRVCGACKFTWLELDAPT